MNKYSSNLRIATIQVCFITLITLFCAASANAQTLTQPATIEAQSPLFTVTHDATLQGDGTTESPLSITASPTVSGSLTVTGDIQAKNIVAANSTVTGALTVSGNIQANATVINDLITVNNVIARSIDVDATTTPFVDAILGGFSRISVMGRGGAGISPDGFHVPGGTGVVGKGGFHVVTGAELFRQGGTGIHGLGGFGINGGIGVRGDGGFANFSTGSGGVGVSARAGNGIGGSGGAGVVATGGGVLFSGNVAGTGIVATGGRGNLGASDGLAADFDGNVLVSGKVMKGSGSFKIDHPLDPENKYLSHSFVESPDMMNIYNGDVTTDSNGDAFVQLPQYFAALNRDFHYQLTVIGAFADCIVTEKVTDNHFRIKTNVPNVKVSWQVTGIRQDAYANMNRIIVEEDKPESERGLYLHPEAFNQPLAKSILMAKQPEIVLHLEKASTPGRKDRNPEH